MILKKEKTKQQQLEMKWNQLLRNLEDLEKRIKHLSCLTCTNCMLRLLKKKKKMVPVYEERSFTLQNNSR